MLCILKLIMLNKMLIIFSSFFRLFFEKFIIAISLNMKKLITVIAKRFILIILIILIVFTAVSLTVTLIITFIVLFIVSISVVDIDIDILIVLIILIFEFIFENVIDILTFISIRILLLFF